MIFLTLLIIKTIIYIITYFLNKLAIYTFKKCMLSFIDFNLKQKQKDILIKNNNSKKS